MPCLECDKPGYYPSTGLCKPCEKECLGVAEKPHNPNLCKTHDCSQYATEPDGYCFSCSAELDSYDDSYYSEYD